jgi:hypothetical protein
LFLKKSLSNHIMYIAGPIPSAGVDAQPVATSVAGYPFPHIVAL